MVLVVNFLLVYIIFSVPNLAVDLVVHCNMVVDGTS